MAANAFHSPPLVCGAVSVRVNDDGWFAATSASELKVNVPKRLPMRFCAYLSSLRSADTLTRCAVCPGGYNCRSASDSQRTVRCVVVIPELPPKASVDNPPVESGSAEATITRPSGSVRYGSAALWMIVTPERTSARYALEKRAL